MAGTYNPAIGSRASPYDTGSFKPLMLAWVMQHCGTQEAHGSQSVGLGMFYQLFKGQ